MKYLALLLLLPAFASAQTVDIKRFGTSPCECRTLPGARISGHNSSEEGVQACVNLSLKDFVERRFTCDFKISVVKPPAVPPVVPPTLGSIPVSWTLPTQNKDGSPIGTITGFEMAYGTDMNNLIQRVTIPANQTSYTIPGLTPGTWYIRMYVRTADGLSDPTNLASKTI